MSVHDPIADAIAIIKNGIHAHQEEVSMPGSSMKVEIVKILKDEGFIDDYKIVNNKNKFFDIKVRLRYEGNLSAISGMKRVSRPSRRTYRNREGIRQVRNGLGIAIVSTSTGVMTDFKARKMGIGGEIICNVW